VTIAQVSVVDECTLELSGVLSFDTVPDLIMVGLEFIRRATGEIGIDLHRVESSDSAGLALLTSWYREAVRLDKTIKFYHIPLLMRNLSRVAGLEDVLPWA